MGQGDVTITGPFVTVAEPTFVWGLPGALVFYLKPLFRERFMEMGVVGRGHKIPYASIRRRLFFLGPTHARILRGSFLGMRSRRNSGFDIFKA
ncbi:hypothetical protein TNCV_2003561 [Trichonephila clavipes]|nr:hypothetical protein TNCV_2003561 [Trichonephila clavipes]